MNNKEIVNKIKKEMPEFKGNNSEIQLKKALYIYIELGKIKAFDEKYYFGNSKQKKEIYSSAKNQERNEKNQDKKITCMSLSKTYIAILKEFEIDAELFKPLENNSHVYPIIKLENGQIVDTDLEKDLYRIQTNSKLRCFGIDENYRQHIPVEDMIQLLKEVGYIEKEEDFRDEDINSIKKETQNLYFTERLKEILNDQRIYKNNDKMEYIEVYKYYLSILKQIMPKEKDLKIKTINCYTINDKDEKDYTMCIYSQDKSNITPYLYSKKHGKFIETDLHKLTELEKNGLILGYCKDEKGVKNLKRHMQNEEEISNEEKTNNEEKTK